ncbi:DEAD/DEAH box helicase [Actinoplanes siamensis]|uniref:DEAD/DEAH box helicase n=1 Tax=Actinoplanes siamensis TaxID=1223317 RepID=UPI001EF1775B|nr:helicase-related protein [Actinoplanes siamensis]
MILDLRSEDETQFRADEQNLSSPGALAAVYRSLTGDEARNAQIIDDVAAALAKGRNCLVLTRRVAHVETLASLLADRGHQALLLQGGMTAADRRAAVDRLAEAKAGDGIVVIGTTPFIGEGFDAPVLDTLFLAGPISFRRPADPMRRPGHPRGARQGRRGGARLPRCGDADPCRLAAAPYARLSGGGLRQAVADFGFFE